MTPSYFLSQPLSQKLVERGVTSQFDFVWCFEHGDEDDPHKITKSVLAIPSNDAEHPHAMFFPHRFEFDTRVFKPYLTTPAIHVFDLLLPENAKRVWGNDLVCENSGINQVYLDDNCERVGGDDYCCAISEEWGSCGETTAWRYKTKELIDILQSNGDYEGYIESTMV